MAEANEKLNTTINVVLEHWGEFMLQRLQQKIIEKNVILSGELSTSLKNQLLKATSESLAHLFLQFEDVGRIRDMKQLYQKKQPPVDVLEKWVREIGVSNFKYVPGYSKGKLPIETNAARRIAWGISIARFKKNAPKPKKWFNKPFYSTLDTLIELLLTGAQESTAEMIKENFESKAA